MGKKLIVISDSHISAGKLDDCDETLDRHHADFFAWLGSRGKDIELVINGDFIDFVQAPPWSGRDLEDETIISVPLCFTEDQSRQKLDAVLAQHPGVFNSLGKFLAGRPGNRLTLLPGNHDADFFWGAVESRFVETLSSGAESVRARISVHLDRSYRPADFPGVWIEHGHQFDPNNRFYLGEAEAWSASSPPILKDRWGHLRLLECIGTRFLIQCLNAVDAEYPMVDNVKPFSRFTTIFGASLLAAPVRFSITFWRMLRFLHQSQGRPEVVLSAGEKPTDVRKQLIGRLRKIHKSDSRFEKRIAQAGLPLGPGLSFLLDDPSEWDGLLDFLGQRPELLPEEAASGDDELLDVDGDGETLSLWDARSVDESAELTTGAKQILKDPAVKLVLMGHTHECQDRLRGLAYLNTGSWTRYYQFRDDEKTRPLALLKPNAGANFPYRLLYAEADSDQPERGSLEVFREG